MLPLMVEGLNADPRTMPRVFHQVDWSNGGDGIVVRDSIKNIAGLRDRGNRQGVTVLSAGAP